VALRLPSISRRLRVALLAGLAVLAFAPAAEAGLLPSCMGTYEKPFARWGDSASYMLVRDGTFEGGASGWSLSGGAKVVAGNEPFFLSGNQLDSHSLLLPAGSSAYSGTVCFALGDWHLRLLMRNVGSVTGGLRVQVIVPSLVGGLLSVLDGGTVKGSGAWSPSPRVALALSNVTSLLGTRAVAFRFTPVGAGAAYQLDDVYLDPWKGT